MAESLSTNELSRQLAQLKKEHDALETAFKKNKSYLETVLNNTPDLIVRIDPNLKNIYANQALYDVTGFTRDQYLGCTNDEIGLPDNLCRLFEEKHLSVFENALPLTFEFDFSTPRNGIRTFQAQVSPELNGNNEVISIISCMRDISEMRSHENALKLARNQWQQTFDSLSDWVSIIDKDCRFLMTNQRSKRFTGKSPADVINICCHDIITNCPDITPCPLEKALETKERVSREIQRADGKWWCITVDPILVDPNTPPCQAIHTVRDITVEKLREKQTLQSKKNAAFRVLAGGIAHDYNNLLAVIMGNISLAIDSFSHDDDRLTFLREADRSLQMARDLSHKFLAISGYEYSEKNIGRLNPVLKAAAQIFTNHGNIAFRCAIDKELWPVNFDASQMGIVFQNLLINGAESMPQGGTLIFRAENIILPREISNINYFKTPGGGRFVKIEIEDTGTGIPEQVQSKIYDPYFSTKKRGIQKGMGLGLAVVSSILENHGGAITMHSVENRGTRVSILIPAYDPKRIIDVTGSHFSGAGINKILVMDDEVAMRNLMGNIIRSMGYRVSLVENSTRAVETFAAAHEAGDSFDLVILDQIIFGSICGSDTLKRLRDIDSKVKSIIISGSPHSPTMSNYREFGFNAALIKPYTRNEVHELIHQVLHP